MRATQALVSGLVLIACGSDETPTQPQLQVAPQPAPEVAPPPRDPPAAEPEPEVAANTAPTPIDAAVAPTPQFTYGARPQACERFHVIVGDEGRRRFKRVRKPWSPEDRKRFRSLVGLVAREMGAEPRLFQAWALRESTYRPSALHVLNPDIEGATTSWRKYAYDPREEQQLQRVLASTDKTSPEFWEAKGRLSKVQTFKDNPFRDARIDYTLTGADGVEKERSMSAWAVGYGPFGFNPTYFLPLWDARSPPWIFCHDDGLVAIVTAVWSARVSQRQCERAGIGGSYLVVNHRFGSGHCGDPGPDAKFRKRARRVGLDPDARARLGRKWKRDETDRHALLAHLRERAAHEGLLPPTVLPAN